jgi:hypothetical protein
MQQIYALVCRKPITRTSNASNEIITKRTRKRHLTLNRLRNLITYIDSTEWQVILPIERSLDFEKHTLLYMIQTNSGELAISD